MITVDEAKKLAALLKHPPDLTHSQVLEAVAHAAGFRDWNTFTAVRSPDDVQRQGVVPILRIFDPALARAFYVDVLGFRWEWEHQLEPGLPVYAQVSRAGRVLHLSEHHGDATPGGAVMVTVPDVRAVQADLLAAAHRTARPGIEENAWGLTTTVIDPFGNRIIFWQREA